MANHLVVPFLSLIFVASTTAAAIFSSHTSDGFVLNNLESGKTFTFGVVPKELGEATTVTFYDVDFSYTDCSQVQIDILNDGYVKRDYNKIAIICDAESLKQFTADSGTGFHIIVKMGQMVNGGTLKARFQASSGTSITSERLFG